MHQELCAILREHESRANTTPSEFVSLQEQFTDKLTSILTSFAQMFTVITGVPCRACIKIIPSEQLSKADIPIEEVIVVAMAER